RRSVCSNWVEFDVVPDTSAAAERLRAARAEQSKDWQAFKDVLWCDLSHLLTPRRDPFDVRGDGDAKLVAFLQAHGMDQTVPLVDGHLGSSIAGRAYLIRAGRCHEGAGLNIAEARTRLATTAGDSYAEVCLDVIGANEDLRAGRRAVAESVL